MPLKQKWILGSVKTLVPLDLWGKKKSLQKNYNERKKAAAHIDNFHVIEQW